MPLVRYWATPVFFALDFFYGVSLRVPFLDALPGAKATYYGIAIASLALSATVLAASYTLQASELRTRGRVPRP